MFVAYEVSLELITCLRTIVPLIAHHDRDLADQVQRAASSIVLNLAEGNESAKGTGRSTSRSRMAARARCALGYRLPLPGDGSRQRSRHRRCSID